MPNIYEETKVITHDEIKDRLKKAYSNNRYLNNITIFRFHDYINQQELKEQRAKKVEELLGLYRENSVVIKADVTIKMLEKELEEMK